MPELPEVEVVRTDLAREIEGRVLVGVEVGRLRAIRRQPDASRFGAAIRGRAVRRVERRGKFLVVWCDGRVPLVVHLGMSGQLRLGSPGEPRIAHTHVVLTFDDAREVRFVDPRTFGQLFVGSVGDAGEVVEIAHLGPEPLGDGLSACALGGLLHGRRARLKPLLMDQRIIAGLGNIYSDEILFRARLRWDLEAGSLDTADMARLHAATRRVLAAAVRERGSSLADAQYVDLYGRPGRFQERHRVYAREGRACPRCRVPIVRERTGGRSTFFCPACQR
jgi:formamidopyrimidine-DNA glycosylase